MLGIFGIEGVIVARADKLSKLVALEDDLHLKFSAISHEKLDRLTESWHRARPMYAEPTGEYPRPALAAGMEQSLRETPMLLKSLPPECRRQAAKALHASITTYHPEFHKTEQLRLEKIKTRRRIRGENEFYLVRHQIDILEGDLQRASELVEWHVLINEFLARHEKGSANV